MNGHNSHFDPEKHHRRSIRLRGYDYSLEGAYFTTICAEHRLCLFADLLGHRPPQADGCHPIPDPSEIHLTDAGRMILKVWDEIPIHYPCVATDAFVVMPNHIHGIIVITDPVGAGSSRPPKTTTEQTAPLRPTLGNVVAWFKHQSTTAINAVRPTPSARVWQRGYFEHIIRDEGSLDLIRECIAENPRQWHLDRENPEGPPLKEGADQWLV